MRITRRAAIATTLAAAAAPAFAGPPADWAPALEKARGGRLGVAVLDTATGRTYAHRGDERFLMCSVFKFILASLVLSRVDLGKENLDRQIRYARADLLEYAPVTRAYVDEGQMTLGSLCAAAVNESDNTAANLILRQIGGPAAVTAYARSLGDSVTRCDRWEPHLNGPDGDLDTTTPTAILKSMRTLALGDALKPQSRAMLVGWMAASRTGDAAVRAGIPADWRRAGKTGNGNDESNDVVVLYPSENRPPILAAGMYFNPAVTGDARRATLAEVGRAVAANFG
jgi:beta-lactamase class A